MVGHNDTNSIIENSYSTAQVSNQPGNVTDLGGLVGENNGTITLSHASGEVLCNGYCVAGGLLGGNASDVLGQTGRVQQSYATGAVANTISSSPPTYAVDGGLVGLNSSEITQSFATGAVNLDATGTSPQAFVDSTLGGLVGENSSSGAVASSYAQGAVSAAFLGTYASTGFGGGPYIFVGGLIGQNGSGSVTQTYAAGPIAFTGTGTDPAIGGLIGGNSTNGQVLSSYWDRQSTGQLGSAGGTSLATAQLQSSSLPTGLDSTVWTSQSGFYPYLQWQASSGNNFYAIEPSLAAVNENAGALAFTVARSDPSEPLTVYISTVQDQGTPTPTITSDSRTNR